MRVALGTHGHPSRRIRKKITLPYLDAYIAKVRRPHGHDMIKILAQYDGGKKVEYLEDIRNRYNLH